MAHILPTEVKYLQIPSHGRNHEDVKLDLLLYLDEGKRVMCPTCDRSAGASKRKVTPEMCNQLVMLKGVISGLSSEQLQQSVNGKDRMYSLLRHWGLIERPEPDFWKITQKGIDFVLGLKTIVQFKHIYNDGVIAESGPQVTFIQCSTNKFNLVEVFDTEL